MERTELREAFFAEVHRDPYGHLLTKMLTEMWAEGYRQAAKDVRDDPLAADSASYSELTRRAAEWITDSRNKAQAEAIIAMAQIGSMLPSEILHGPRKA